MRNFFLGVLAGLVIFALAIVGLVVSVRSESAPAASPSVSPSPVPSGKPASPQKDETWLGDVDLSSSEVLTSGGGFEDVTAKGTGIRVSDKGIHAEKLDLDVTLPWAAAAKQVGDGVELYAAGSGQVGLSRTIEVLGQKIPVKATGVVRAVEGDLVIEPKTIDLQGPDWLDTVASAAARSLVSIRQPVQGVPDGMRLTQVSPIESGFRATLTGSNVSITN